MQDSDAEAARAWNERVQAVRHGCAAAVRAVAQAGRLTPGVGKGEATDLLWTLLSVETWKRLVRGCGWPQARSVKEVKALARSALLSG